MNLIIKTILALFFCFSVFSVQAKDKSISKRQDNFHFSKDLASGGEWEINSNSAKKKYSVMIVSAEDGHPVRDGKKSLRFEVRAGDCGWSSTWNLFECERDRERVEINYKKRFSKGEYWYAWSIYLPKDHQSIWPALLNMVQFHTTKSGTTTPFIMFKNGTSNYRNLGEKDDNDSGGYALENLVDGYNINLLLTEEQMIGRWNDMLVNINWSHKNDGWIKAWANDELVYEYNGPTKTKDYKAKFKFGIYRNYVSKWGGYEPSEWAKKIMKKNKIKIPKVNKKPIPTTVVYYDEIRIGSTKEKVVGNLSALDQL